MAKQTTYSQIKKKQQLDAVKKQKDKYFDFYDDVKHHSRGVEDW